MWTHINKELIKWVACKFFVTSHTDITEFEFRVNLAFSFPIDYTFIADQRFSCYLYIQLADDCIISLCCLRTIFQSIMINIYEILRLVEVSR